MSSYPTSSRATLEKSSLKYAERGKPTFPCRGNKAPCTPNGFKDATSDPDRLAEIWRRYPGEKIGMPTGRASGVFDVDVDRLEALGELPAEMPETLTVRTPRGGLHFFFNHVEGLTNRTGALPSGIDVRGDGGYVIVPPSPGYEVERLAPVADAPGWLLDLIRAEQEQRPRSGESGAFVDNGEPIPEGGRNDTLARIVGRLHDGTRGLGRLEEDAITVNEARCLPPLPAEEVRRIARSVFRYEPCKPVAGDRVPETAAALARVEEIIMNTVYRDKGGKTRRSLAVAWLKIARKHAYLDENGNPSLDVGYRQWALEAAVSRRTAMDQVRKMEEFRVDGEGSKSGKSGTITFLLPSAPIFTTLPTGGRIEEGCEDSRAPFTASRLRWSSPPRKSGKRGVVTGTRRVRQSVGSKARDAVERLGKSCENAVDDVEAAGGSMRLDDLAAKLGVKRTRDLTRRVNPKTGKGRDGFVTKLVAAGVFEVHGDTVALVDEWLEALNEERERSGEIALFRRDLAQYNRESDGYRNRSKGGATAVARDATPEADGHIGELHLVEELDRQVPAVSPLAEGVRDYLDKNPSDARRTPYWIGTTLWSFDLFDGKPTAEETAAAIEDLGGAAYLEENLRRARGVA